MEVRLLNKNTQREPCQCLKEIVKGTLPFSSDLVSQIIEYEENGRDRMAILYRQWQAYLHHFVRRWQGSFHHFVIKIPTVSLMNMIGVPTIVLLTLTLTLTLIHCWCFRAGTVVDLTTGIPALFSTFLNKSDERIPFIFKGNPTTF